MKQVSHSWHIVLDTDTLYTFLNFINQFISLLNLHLESELIIVIIDFENLHSVYRSLEIHNCALTSSPPLPPSAGPPLPPPDLPPLDPREAQTLTLGVPWQRSATTSPREDPPQEGKKSEHGAGGKKREIGARRPPPFGPLTFSGFGPHSSWPPPLWPHPCLDHKLPERTCVDHNKD